MVSIPIFKYDLDGNFIAEYESVSDAAHFNSTTHTKILNALKRESKYCCGFLWSFEYKLSLEPYISRIKKVYQYDFDGNFIKEWDDVHKAAKFFNCGPNSIRQSIRKKTGSRGYLWSYIKK